MYEDFKRRLSEHIDEFGTVIPWEPSVAETYLIYALVLRLEELEKEYDDLLMHSYENVFNCSLCKFRQGYGVNNECRTD